MLENSEKLNNQAIRYALQGEYDDAIACLKRAITVEKQNHLLWYNLALTYRDAGDLNGAKNSMLYAYRLNPYDEETLDSLISLCIMLENYQEASYYCTEGLQINCMNPHFWNSMGVVNFNIEEYADAAECFERAVSLSPSYYDSLYNLRDTYEELGNKIGVEECNRKMSQLSKDMGNE